MRRLHYFNWVIGLTIFAGLLAACQPQPNQIFIEVDGRREALSTEDTTVREALDEANIILEPLDKVSPDLYVQLEPGLVIIVTRVTEETETRREMVPFERQTVVNEALQPGENRIAQLGVNGEDEITIRIVYEDGQEVSRLETARVPIIEAVPEILVIGPQGELPATNFAGTIAYLSNGNAWLMQENTGNRRALTTSGDLDGHVFNLSPDGRQLVFTRQLTNEIELPINDLWLASTTIVGEEPLKLDIGGVLDAEWSPDSAASTLIYSTAERVANPPGWRANNDLWLLELAEGPGQPQQILEANTQGLYPWWGMSVTWSPAGDKLAYARPDQIGVIDMTPLTETIVLSESLTALVDFAPLQTFSEWVWTPQLSWSPDGRFIAATIHGPPVANEPPQESQIFDLWLLSVDGAIQAKVAEEIGMWANPKWGDSGIVFGRATTPLQSVNSRYTIQIVDRDGSNQRQIFPFSLEEDGVRLPDFTWGPTGDQILVIDDGNLFITSNTGSPPRQLTADTQASQPQWVGTGAAALPETISQEAAEGTTSTVPITPLTTITTSGQTLTDTVIPEPATITPQPVETPAEFDIEEFLKD